MRRLLWLGVGLAVGALVFRALSRKAQSFTPEGIAGSLQQSAVGLVDSVRTFVDDVREGMAEREAEIREAIEAGLILDEDLLPEEGDEHR
jgi:hypothetical protein